jgi:phosphatidylserine/phosphatidylglycerophosphate/cardiolipin synthase-like enzyme
VIARTVVALALFGSLVAPVAAEPTITGVYPNPATDGDHGEFVTVDVPAGTDLSEYTLVDDGEPVSLAALVEDNSTATDRELTLSTNATLTRRLTDRATMRNGTERAVFQVERGLQLANSGDTVSLRHNGTVVDDVRYESAPESEIYHAETREWEPLGATEFAPVTADSGRVEAFVLPDSPDRAVEFLSSAEERILLAGYTLSADRVVETLREASDRGVAVDVLVDGSPVGGMDASVASALDRLERAEIPVSVVGGERARYRHHHAKYAVVDDRALVTTENWKPSGTGGHSSRGWGVITNQSAIVDGLTDTFRADADWVGTVPWSAFERPAVSERNLAEGDGSTTRSYPTAFEPESFPVNRTRLLLAPDNARAEIRAAIRAAEDSIDIKQMSVGAPDFAFLQAVVDAAERGVEVRILLSSAWYVEEDNRRLQRWLDDQAAAADLPIETRLATPGDAFEKIHAKGVILDGNRTIIGSINWNENSVQNNREVALLVEGERAAAYFEAVFEADWSGDDERPIPLGLVAAALVCALLTAGFAARQIRWGGSTSE